MTFIRLEKNHTVRNKINSILSKSYEKNSKETWTYDENIDSKNVSFLGDIPQSYITKENFNIAGDNADNVLLLLQRLNREANNNNTISIDRLNYFKQEIADLGFSLNELIKTYNLKNTYGIENVQSKFIVNADAVLKKNFIKKSVYRKYSDDFELDYYKDLTYGFCNYNSLSFGSYNSKRHYDSIVYSNYLSDTSTHKYNILNNNYTLSFKFNVRDKSFYSNPGCILFIPGEIAIYVVSSNLSDDSKLRLLILFGEKTFNDDINFENWNPLFDVVSYYENDVILTSTELIQENYWHTFSLSCQKNNSVINAFYCVDSEKIDDVVLNTTRQNSELNSIIQIGSRLKEINTQSDVHNVYSKLFNIESKKFRGLKENDHITYSENPVNVVTNDITKSFVGEISDIRIYSTYHPYNFHEDFHTNYVINLENEIKQHSLCFYVPVLFVNVERISKNVCDCHGNVDFFNNNLYFNKILASTCLGYELNVENYLVEYVTNNIPNILINCNDNTPYNEDSTYYILEEIKSFIINNSGYIDTLTSSGKTFSEICITHSDNFEFINKKNSLILPNDNGIPTINFDIIRQYSVLHDQQLLNNFPLNTYYNLSNENVLDSDLSYNIENPFSYFDNSRIEGNFIQVLTTNGIKELEIKKDFFETFSIMLKESIDYNSFLKFKEFALSNIEQTDQHPILKNNVQLNLHRTILSNLENFNANYIHTSNIFIRNMFGDVNYDYAKNKAEIVVKFNSDNEVLSFTKGYYSPYYDFMMDKDNPFINIFVYDNLLLENKLEKKSITMSDVRFNLHDSHMTLKDNGYGSMYRSDCLSKQATWNYVGNIFYKEGIVILQNPLLRHWGIENFKVDYNAHITSYVNELNIPVDRMNFNVSNNLTHDKDLRHDSNPLNVEEPFVYITNINIHDENYNIIQKANLSRPIPKKESDRFLIRLGMDY